jgi:hypothetical protein
MSETPQKLHIQLALTPRQKRQIREATGRDINTLELRLAPFPEPIAPADREHESGALEETRATPRRQPRATCERQRRSEE